MKIDFFSGSFVETFGERRKFAGTGVVWCEDQGSDSTPN